MLNKKHLGMMAGTLLGMMLLGGCMKGETENVEKESNAYVSVQDYTGQGYRLPNGDKNDKIAEANKDEVVQSMEEFFLNNYQTKVKVHNIIGNKDGATVYVESLGAVKFSTFAIIPIDNQGKLRPEGIWTEPGQVEYAIQSGIYAMVYEDQLATLDAYLTKFAGEHPVVGLTDEALKKTFAGGFSTPYYYITMPGESFDALSKQYLEKPETTKEEYQAAVKSLKRDPEEYNVVIRLFMKEKNQKPDKQIFDQLVSDIEAMENLPLGAYSIFLHDNEILKGDGQNSKDNTLAQDFPNEIYKK
ncbi:DUF1672 family protein [Fictibacillus iocasae]|uniref:DUF1672 family protein n=1 Tax=Fictibacillus iocasae TaxID=2715437 RepID=A0ABW2NPH7_9BACL